MLGPSVPVFTVSDGLMWLTNNGPLLSGAFYSPSLDTSVMTVKFWSRGQYRRFASRHYKGNVTTGHFMTRSSPFRRRPFAAKTFGKAFTFRSPGYRYVLVSESYPSWTRYTCASFFLLRSLFSIGYTKS